MHREELAIANARSCNAFTLYTCRGDTREGGEIFVVCCYKEHVAHA